MEIAKDATLTDLEWASWEDEGAVGTARLRVLECTPNCAQATSKVVTARVRLSKPVECAQGRFFDASEVTIAGRDPMSFIQAPC